MLLTFVGDQQRCPVPQSAAQRPQLVWEASQWGDQEAKLHVELRRKRVLGISQLLAEGVCSVHRSEMRPEEALARWVTLTGDKGKDRGCVVLHLSLSRSTKDATDHLQKLHDGLIARLLDDEQGSEGDHEDDGSADSGSPTDGTYLTNAFDDDESKAVNREHPKSLQSKLQPQGRGYDAAINLPTSPEGSPPKSSDAQVLPLTSPPDAKPSALIGDTVPSSAQLTSSVQYLEVSFERLQNVLKPMAPESFVNMCLTKSFKPFVPLLGATAKVTFIALFEGLLEAVSKRAKTKVVSDALDLLSALPVKHLRNFEQAAIDLLCFILLGPTKETARKPGEISLRCAWKGKEETRCLFERNFDHVILFSFLVRKNLRASFVLSF